MNEEISHPKKKRQGSYLHPDNLLTPWIPNSGLGMSSEVIFLCVYFILLEHLNEELKTSGEGAGVGISESYCPQR